MNPTTNDSMVENNLILIVKLMKAQASCSHC